MYKIKRDTINKERNKMNYEKACELLKISVKRDTKRNAAIAESMLSNMTNKAPLRYKVAAQVIIDNAK